MSRSKSHISYRWCQEIFDQAMEAEHGIRVSLESEAQAKHTAQKFNSFRKMDRDRSLKIYQPGDPMYGVSAYDELEVRVRGSDILLAKVRAEAFNIAPLAPGDL